MVTGESEAFATRLPAREAERVLEAVEQTDRTRASLLERALRYYLAENPDDIPVLRDGDHQAGPLEKAGILPEEANEDTLEGTNLDLQRTK